MALVKFISKIEQAVWADLRTLVRKSHQRVSGLLSAVRRDLDHRRRVRAGILDQLGESVAENETLGELLAR